MTALYILKALKSSNRKGLLFINNNRKEAAYHDGIGSYCETVDYFEAMIAKTDPSLVIVDITDGITYAVGTDQSHGSAYDLGRMDAFYGRKERIDMIDNDDYLLGYENDSFEGKFYEPDY